MPSRKRKHVCKLCGRREEDGFTISRNGYCEECGLLCAIGSIYAMAERQGPLWLKFKRNWWKAMIRKYGEGVVPWPRHWDPLPEMRRRRRHRIDKSG